MELNLTTVPGIATKENSIQLADQVFACEFNEALVHQVVTAYMAAARSGSKAQKTRSEVRGGGAKPWKQKGTGRARAGTTRGPVWRSGGVTFAAKPRSYEQKVNKKMYKGAMRSIFSELIRQNRLLAVASFALEAPKTKDLLKKLQEMQLTDVMIVTDEVSENLYLAARNLYHVDVRDADDIDPVSLVGADKIIITTGMLKKIEERLL